MSSAAYADGVAAGRPTPAGASDTAERDAIAARVDASLVASLAEPTPSGQRQGQRQGKGGGQGGALAALYARHGTGVYSIAAAMCGPKRAAEITTDVFVSLCRRPEAFPPERGSLRTYLTRYAHRLAVKTLRADTPLWPDGGPEGNRQSADEPAEALLDRAGGEVRNTLRGLPAAPRSAIVLAYYGGHTIGELSTRTDPSGPPAGQLLRTGLTRLHAANP